MARWNLQCLEALFGRTEPCDKTEKSGDVYKIPWPDEKAEYKPPGLNWQDHSLVQQSNRSHPESLPEDFRKQESFGQSATS